MSNTSINFNKKEKNVRKFWLGFSIFNKFIYPLITFVISNILAHKCINFLNSLYPSEILNSYSLIFMNFIPFMTIITVNALIFWWAYHCAYKKSGTALLLFFLIINPLFFVIYLSYSLLLLFLQYSPGFTEYWSQLAVQLSKDFGTDSNALVQFIKNALNFLITLFILESILTVVWFISCLKLRKVNKKLKAATPSETLSNPA